MSANTEKNNICRIVLTGGPGAGKTTAADLLRREIGESIIVVPEAATMLFAGGFPRTSTSFARKSTQTAIYHVQKNLEAVQASEYPDRVLLCDRGTLDSAIYWPEGPEAFFRSIESHHQKELERYDAVVFFETAAVGNLSIEGGNPHRTENLQQAVELDKKLQEIWSPHPNYHFISHETSFIKKMNKSLSCLQSIIEKHRKSL